MTSKQTAFTKKWKSFHDHIDKYNKTYPSVEPLKNYTVEEAKSLSLEDTFWNFGHLTHPNENWAVDKDTQIGIQAYLLFCRCNKELRRIAREVRQQLKWAILTASKIADVEMLLHIGEFSAKAQVNL